jgi:hypothetical protein
MQVNESGPHTAWQLIERLMLHPALDACCHELRRQPRSGACEPRLRLDEISRHERFPCRLLRRSVGAESPQRPHTSEGVSNVTAEKTIDIEDDRLEAGLVNVGRDSHGDAAQ